LYSLYFKLYYQLLHLTYICKLARYRVRTPWGWHNSVETCRRTVIIRQLIVQLLVTVQNKHNVQTATRFILNKVLII